MAYGLVRVLNHSTDTVYGIIDKAKGAVNLGREDMMGKALGVVSKQESMH